ncbi:MAG: metallophosphoesterase [Methanophagales archaeon]|nr:metallophosphoesterase [Methanophagales archaeon]
MRGLERIFVRGNHDTFLGPLKRFPNIKIVNELCKGDILFIHGHNKDFLSIIRRKKKKKRRRTIVVAHEHPFLILGDRVGARVRLPCFLKGKLKLYGYGHGYGYDKNLIVMPAFSPLAGGIPVNVVNKEEFLSSILKSAEVDRDEMEVYAVDEEIGMLEFPELRKWKAVSLCL